MRFNRLQVTLALVVSLLAPMAFASRGEAATTLPSGFTETVVSSANLFAPTLMAFAPDGRLFVAQQNGVIRILKNGVMLSTPFIRITGVETSTDRGVLGLAFDPNFATNKYIYVYYHRSLPSIHGVISRFVAAGDLAVPGSETVIYTLDNLVPFGVHTGGTMNFGPDGKLYVSVGDDSRGTIVSQSLTSDLGKMLRINADGSMPTDNPFFAQATGKYRSIWAIGLRNPYTWTFESSTGRMLINDVGLATSEEVNIGAPGANYGWPTCEGPCQTPNPNFTDPVYSYGHGFGPDEGCATIGGDFAQSGQSNFPASFNGLYFFADYCGGWIKTYNPVTGAVAPFATGIVAPTNFRFGPDGSLYYVSREQGTGGPSRVIRISYTGSLVPTIDQQPQSQLVSIGNNASFNVTANGGTPLSYHWLRDGSVIPGAISSAYQVNGVTATDDGARFSVVVTNSYGTITSSEAILSVTSNQPPVPTIVAPLLGATYAAGDSIYYAGSATDPEDGTTLPASAFSWTVEFRHLAHVHPFLGPIDGVKASRFSTPASNFEVATSVWFRVYLTVTDSQGVATTVFRDVLPRLTTITVKSSPKGAPVTLEGAQVATPAVFSSVARMSRTLGAVSPVTIGGASWVFDTWSDFGAATHDVVPPNGQADYTAVYRLNAGATGTGTGLKATYFNNVDLTSEVVSQVEPIVMRSVPLNTAPAPGVSPGTYSVRWDGQVASQFNQNYTFFAQADDGVRLWVGNVLVIDQWGPHALTDYQSAPIPMVAGAAVPIRIEFRQGSPRLGRVVLSWKSSSVSRSVIPRTQLYPAP